MWVVDIETEVASLITDMNHSIKEADAFVNAMWSGVNSSAIPRKPDNRVISPLTLLDSV